MRSLMVGISVFGMVSAAQAADLPDLPILRGGLTEGLNNSRVNWDGYYAGIQGGYGSTDQHFSNTNAGLASGAVQGTVIGAEMPSSTWNWSPGFGSQTSRSSSWGAFAGYNSQWDDVVLGVEANYMHGPFGIQPSAARAFVSAAALSDTLFHRVTVTQTTQMSITDMATIRGRAGYVMGAFLPYAHFGVAIGNANIGQTATVQDSTGAAAAGPFTVVSTFNANNLNHNRLIYGYSAGLGVDVNLVGGLFARAEYEYVRFTSTVETNINTVRAGVGYKF
ncbi:outer membrane protein [Bradyrhizobium sp. HKCCYLS20291]|uniref:outer membrane protein n=1 Tax=Bradyrhizobium sp. HKCCYLS20291 TaxID=3420766 RepID=UPI003EB8E720